MQRIGADEPPGLNGPALATVFYRFPLGWAAHWIIDLFGRNSEAGPSSVRRRLGEGQRRGCGVGWRVAAAEFVYDRE